MSCNTNVVVIAGNLTRDPEMRYTPQGTAVCNIGLANSQRWNDRDGNKQERRLFIRVTAWDKQAESAGLYLKKGDPVLVEGELSMEEWDDPKSGEKRSQIVVRASRVQFLKPADREPAMSGVDASPASRAPVRARY